ncbi:ribonuclease R family protein [Acaryochloris sp. IP29b_bin.137]|uniref:ribonuclease R family protein n=1 Tax=Acaryochloris sp. IP29b_bin.137 TaxID=2969217 RepID=UPI0026212945|nr:ribonuclease R family protein [Acaryochloris sp. IP29b_bin.137]
MEFSISALLNNFADDKLLAPKALEKKLDCQASDNSRQLQITLDALEKVGILTKERGKYKRLSEDGVIEGKLRCSSKGFCFAIQDEDDTEDIYIRESQLNTAWNGDRVLVKVTKEGRRRRSPEGEVRLILERSNPSVIARVKKTDESEFRAVPLDDRLLFELVLHQEEDGPELEAAIDQLVHVEIVRYPLGQRSPLGRVTQVLGSDAQSAADTELVFCKYDLPRRFPDPVIEAAEALPKKLRKTDQKKRLALQKVPTHTIGDADSHPTQLDHAFSVEKLKGNQWRLGVHVTDLVYYFDTDSPIDRQARQRSAAMFLGDTVLPLFPEICVDRIGALTPGKEHLTFSILITLSDEGEVLEFEIQPSVIHVDGHISYQQVQEILEGDNAPGKDVITAISHLQTVSDKVRHHRFSRGSFDLCLPTKPAQMIGDEGDLGTVILSPPAQAHSIATECLVLANQLVISHLQALAIPAIYQIQAPPDAQDLQDLIKLADNIQLSLSLQQEETVQPQDFQTFSQTIQSSEMAPILFELLQTTLKPVQYSAVSGPHFGLALVNNYGHFTAPLNRYSDLLNQRILQAVLTEGRDRRTSRAKEKVNLRHSSCHGQISWNVLPPETQRHLEALITDAISYLNEQANLARQASQDLAGLQKTKQMQTHTGEVLQGIITGIQSYGFFVRIETLMVEGLVHVSSLKDDWYEYRSRQQTLVGRKNRCQYRLGDRVDVEVKSVDYYRQQIDLIVVGGGSEASEEDTIEPPVKIGDEVEAEIAEGAAEE